MIFVKEMTNKCESSQQSTKWNDVHFTSIKHIGETATTQIPPNKSENNLTIAQFEQVQAHHKKGLEFLLTKDYKKAIAEFDLALKLSPEFHPSYTQRGATYFILGEYQNAISNLNMASQFDPDNYGIYYYRSMAYFGLKQYLKASEDIAIGLKLLPGNTTYLGLQKQYNGKIKDEQEAQMHHKTGLDFVLKKEYKKAIAEFSLTLKLHPEFYLSPMQCSENYLPYLTRFMYKEMLHIAQLENIKKQI